jgi:hypothetical protein
MSKSAMKSSPQPQLAMSIDHRPANLGEVRDSGARSLIDRLGGLEYWFFQY